MANYYNKDLYKILNLDYTASEEEIKSSYRKLVRLFHPDIAGNSPSNITVFKDIQEAYEILSNAQTRKKYDILKGFNKEQKAKTTEKSEFVKKNYEEYLQKAKTNAKKAQSFSKAINDALENLFNGTQETYKKKEAPPLRKDGGDINLDLTISAVEALKGTNRKINILHTQPCPNCKGRKFLNGSQCPMCSGTGQRSIQKKINVKIPKGVVQGSKVRIKKEGNKGTNGGKDGDLYLNIIIEKNPYFEFDGLNILCNLPVAPYEAALGAEIPVKFYDETITITIPEMTSSGQKLRLTGLGLENKEKTKRGDIIVTVMIKISQTLTEKEKEIYEQLKLYASDDIRKDMNNEQQDFYKGNI